MKMSDKIRALQLEVDDLKFAMSRLTGMVLDLQQCLADANMHADSDETIPVNGTSRS